MSGTPWTEPEDARLRELWGDGKSASFCVEEIPGRSRNAVIGRVHRLDLQNKARKGKPPRPKKPRGPYQPRPTPIGQYQPRFTQTGIFIPPSNRKSVPIPHQDTAKAEALVKEGLVTKCPPRYAYGASRAESRGDWSTGNYGKGRC